MTVVVDASVALKWVIQEDGSEAAEALLRQEPLLAPDLLIVECANVLWVKTRRRGSAPRTRRRGVAGDPSRAGSVAARGGLHRYRPGDGF